MIETVDHAIARIAGRQRGHVTTAQLRALGLSEAAIRRRVEAGRLHRRHRGVFAVGLIAPIPLAAEHAAMLACGGGAALTHRSGSVLWELLPPAAGPVDVTCPSPRRRNDPGIRVHTTALAARDVWTRKGLRVTTPRRTLIDLAAVVGPVELARAVDAAYAKGLVRPGTIQVPDGTRGAARLRAVLEGRGVTRSGLERRFLALVERAGLPKPETNARVAGLVIDVLWREQRVAVELDTLGTHATKVLSDRAKDLTLREHGFTALRFTDVQVDEQAPRVLFALAQAATWHVRVPSRG